MKLQLLSDLHLESETFEPEPAPGAELLILAGDIDSTWRAYERFAGWPVPVYVVAGNHEFDGRDVDAALPALRAHCGRYGLDLLERETRLLHAADGKQTVRLIGTTRWTDFEGCGVGNRPRAMRVAAHVLTRCNARRAGRLYDAQAVRSEALICRDWLARVLTESFAETRAETLTETPAPGPQQEHRTLVVTHYAPSLRSADPRYGHQPGTASFCNADDALIPHADLWLHGHLHCRHDYRVERPARASVGAPTRVVCHARGLAKKRETLGYAPLATLDI